MMSNLQIAVAAFSAICALIFVPIAAFFYFTGRKYQALAAASAAWPTVPGRVLACEVIEQRRPKGGNTYRSNICYEYGVSGTRHEGTVIQFGAMDMATEAAAQKILDPYPVGASVTVHYHPDSPDVATLETLPAAADSRLKMAKWTLVIGVVIYVALVGFAHYAIDS
jgi:Protein of unknown function (DUF3592)